MTAEKLRALEKAKPFRPFRIRTTLGEQFDVVSPHHFLVGPKTVLIGVDIEDDIPGSMVHRGLQLIDRTEEIVSVR